MPITCGICQQEFEKIIPWQHLRVHGMDSKTYRQHYGSLYGPETLEKFQARIPHNLGKKVTDADQLSRIRSAIAQREQRFQNGEIKRGVAKTAAEKQALSEKIKSYAANHPDKIQARAQKALMTKLDNGYDFGQNMRGKTHSDLTRKLISQKSKLVNQQKSQQANDRILERITKSNLTLKNSIDSWTLELHCDHCNSDFSFTKQYFHLSKFRDTICPTCYPRSRPSSSQELKLYQFVKQLCPDAIQNHRPRYHDLEIDIYMPERGIGIEYNGLYWHSEPVLLHNNRSPKHDHQKLLEFRSQNIRLIQVFEDEWINNPHIVKSRIANILGKTPRKIPARKCQVREISSKQASAFCNSNHILGSGRSNIRLGLYHDQDLVAVMTFSKNNLSRKILCWELNRYSSLIDVAVIGGASKLFQAFLRLCYPDKVVSFSDNRWSDGALYQRLGFQKINDGTPNYWYTLPNTPTRIHRFNLRKTSADPRNLTEYQLRTQQGYSRIWDSGSSRWEWTNGNRALGPVSDTTVDQAAAPEISPVFLIRKGM